LRPIELTVTGLHSFREKQTVNFDSLCEGGVFGIFGPTGSGKSSLLDAITLALYGRVERAAGSTQGILNHAENELSVALTFDLGIDEPKRFRVERVYKRSKSDGLTIGSCRMLRLDLEEPVVLADKERDVTQQVKDILGLTHDDFTRAVVLPQGKFAEFLSLKGADRRRMLQRLFNMEKYGDRLNDVIKGRLNQATNRLEAIQSGQQELGDASKEALGLAEKAYNNANSEVKVLSDNHQKMKETFENAKQKREWQTALDTLLEKEMTLTAKIPEMEATRERLNKARSAALVMPYVNEYETTEKSLFSARVEKEEAEKTFHEISTIENEKKKEYETISERITQETPIYEERRGKLREAIRINDDIEIKQKGLFQLRSARDEVKNKLEQKEQLILGISKEREEIQGEKDKLRDSLKDLRIDINVREQVAKALAEKNVIENKQASYHEWLEQWKTIKNGLKDNEERTGKEKSILDKSTDGLRNLFSRYEALYYDVSSTKKGLDTVLDWLALKEEDTQKAIQDATINHLAAKLAAQLQDESPCPVCGAIHHPEPAVTSKHDITEELQEKVHFYRQCSQWINKAINTAGANQATIEQRVQQIESLSTSLVPNIHQRKEIHLPDLSAWTIDDLKAWMTSIKGDLQGFKQDVLALDEQLTPLTERFQQASKQYLILSTQHENFEKQESAVSEKVKVLKESLDQQLKNWAVTYPDFDYQKLGETQERMHRLDRKAHDVNEQIEKHAKALEVLEQKKAMVDAEINELHQQFARFDEGVRESSRTLETLLSDYKKAMGDVEGDATQALQHLQDEWTMLKAEEAKKRDEWETAKKERFEVEKHLSNAIALFKSTNKQAEEKGAALVEQLKRTGFSNFQTVKDASLEESAIERYEKLIQQFDQEISQMKNEKESLQLKIGSDPMSVEAFESLQQAFNELGIQRDQALEERAKLHNEWQSLTEKHERFTQLEKERLEMAELQSQLQKLSSIFRGNGFVEYIAEEQMEQISRDASERLGKLTRRRYALEVDSGGGFVIRDDANGGIRRPVSSLSGGETFLTSLALALSLSAQIQLRGEVPLQFFFLDEGFGTLDPELLDTVITALEKLQTERMSIGVISHVPEMQERLVRKLFVEPAEPSGRGSRLHQAII
jgi:DNA repair protein SbcC/Rad50